MNANLPAPTLSQINAMLASMRASIEGEVSDTKPDKVTAAADKLLKTTSSIAKAELDKVTIKSERDAWGRTIVETRISDDSIPKLHWGDEHRLLREIEQLKKTIEKSSAAHEFKTHSFQLLEDLNQCWKRNANQRLLCASLFLVEIVRSLIPFKK